MSPVVGASASAAIRDRIVGPPTEVRVLAVFPAAVYLDHPDGVLAVVARDGIHHPNAIAVGPRIADHPFATVVVGAPGRVGSHRVELAGLRIAVRRWWRPRPALPPLDATGLGSVVEDLALVLATAAAPLPPELAAPAARLRHALARGDTDEAIARCGDLLGLGPGLTPSGDDLLAGLFAAVSLLAPALARRGRPIDTTAVRTVGDAVVARAAGATTSISAALLHHAVAGEVSDVAAGVFSAMAGVAPLTPAVRALLAVGATSGRDLSAGILVGARLTRDLADAASLPVPAASQEMR